MQRAITSHKPARLHYGDLVADGPVEGRRPTPECSPRLGPSLALAALVGCGPALPHRPNHLAVHAEMCSQPSRGDR